MEFRVSVGAAAYWVARARGKRVDRVRLTNRKPGRAWNRTPRELEQRILSVRSVLREKSVLGEYGSDAISLTLQYKQALEQVRSRMTIYRCWRVTAYSMACIDSAGQHRPRAGICSI